ncbi:family 5 glycoside hydrolase, partial [Rhodotorula sp. JG-1b]
GGTFDADPFSYDARAQRFTKPLSEPWDWETDRIRGVNLGGWLSLEPFITPSLFERYLDHVPEPARDEWSLSELVRADKGLDGSTGTERLERFLRTEHYDRFITEDDFAEIAAAGLNWIRLPFPFWAIETWPGEPFLEKVAWEYVLKAIEWARKYGLRINLDLHSLPGSQNGWNHSGKLGPIGFLQSAMGLANAQRTLDYLAALAVFCTRDGVRQVVGMLSVANEVPLLQVGQVAVKSFYAEAYERIRNVTGYGAGNGPVRCSVAPFAFTKTRWIAGLDRVALDSHRYMAFLAPQQLDGIEDHLMKPCLKWAADFNRTFSTFGIPVSGEFSLAINDCGRFLNNVAEGNRLEGTFPNESHPQFPPSAPVGTCEFWERYDLWDEDMKSSLRDFARAQMDAFQNWFYWTWKTTPSSRHFPHLEANPLWSYSLGVREGWIPRDPRDADGFC